MTEYETMRLELAHDDIRFIASDAKGLCYAVDDDGLLAIFGKRGKTLLTRYQAIAAARELAEIVDMYVRGCAK